MHNKCILICIYFFIVLNSCSPPSDKFRQERAKVAYSNPKYVTDAVVFTGRLKRGDPYYTNGSAVLLQPWGNNVSILVSLEIRKGNPALEFRFKLCDFMKVEWFQTFVRHYSNITLCPFPTGAYYFYNVELPPKNFPFPIPKGDYLTTLLIYMTDTREKMLEIIEILHI